MIKEPARIVAIDSETVWLASDRQSTCQSCQMKQGCGQGIMSELKSEPQLISLTLPRANSSLAVEDEVDIGIKPSSLLMAAGWVYLLPLILMLLSALICEHYWVSSPQQEWFSAIAALVGFALGFIIVKLQAIIWPHKFGQIAIIPKDGLV